jgi:glycosyltransferase involved in cell wall biosynthesis
MDVSVVVPTRNRSALLATTLRSVLRQQDVDLEVIVVDEASTDDTPTVLAAIGDARVRVIRHDAPRWLAAARNNGASEARGEWLAFLDDDDLWAPDKLIRQIQAAEQANRDWVYAGSVNFEGCRITHARPPRPPQEVVPALLRFNPIPGGGSNILGRREAWRRAGPFDTRLRSAEDWEMSIRLSKHGPPAWVCSPLIAKRVHASNMSLDVDECIRATKLIEALHDMDVDWGQVHRWLAERYLRTGNRRSALGQFGRAAIKGQVRGVVSDLSASVRRRLGLTPKRDAQTVLAEDRWKAAAATWLREFESCIQ